MPVADLAGLAFLLVVGIEAPLPCCDSVAAGHRTARGRSAPKLLICCTLGSLPPRIRRAPPRPAQAWNRLTMIVSFCPPNPKLLLSATFTFAGRDLFGT